MSRSNYSDDCDSNQVYLWEGAVKKAIKGKRGQAFLRELARLMDAMKEKVLIEGCLIDADGDCCTIGVILKAREVDVSGIDPECPEEVAEAAGIARAMAAEIEYQNDEAAWDKETPEERWVRMRKWVARQLGELA